MKAISTIILTTLLLILTTIIVWANDVKMSASVEPNICNQLYAEIVESGCVK